MAEPEVYFTEAVMNILEEHVKERFSYGSGSEVASEDISSEESS